MSGKQRWRGRWACSCVIGYTTDLERRLGRSLHIYQASYSGGVAASAGTHDGGGALDITMLSQSDLAIARSTGAAAWNRTPRQGFSYHTHMEIVGCPHLSRGAAYQVSEYKHGRNGLKGRGRDDGPRVKIVRWSAYHAARATKVKAETAAAAAKAKAGAKTKALIQAKAKAASAAAAKKPITIGGTQYPGIGAVGLHWILTARSAKTPAVSRHVYYVQVWLKKTGHYTGVCDGIWSRATQTGYDNFREAVKWNGAQTGPPGLGSLDLLNDKARSAMPVRAK